VKSVEISVLVVLFVCYVRSILEYGAIVFSPHHMYLVDLLENAQSSFTKRLPGLSNMKYLIRLRVCNLETRTS
jgi:hypothetical protein